MTKLKKCVGILGAILTQLSGCVAWADEYQVSFGATLRPNTQSAHVAIEVQQDTRLLRRIKFRAQPPMFEGFKASDGAIEWSEGQIDWHVPPQGGTLSYSVQLNQRRKGGGYDTRITPNWALLRFNDLFPAVKSVSRAGSDSNSDWQLMGPPGWSIETQYGPFDGEPQPLKVFGRKFDQPTGWLIAGKLGVRRDVVAHRRFSVAAPAGSHYDRVPTLAFLRWIVPEFVQIFPTLPKRVLIMSGDEAMWRGAISGPGALYIHKDRPLISENSTSPLIHELVHLATRWLAAEGDDWIVEGLAEYYSIEVLRRSGGISEARFTKSIEKLASWVAKNQGALKDPSQGVDTARALLLFRDLDLELVAATGKRLDTLVRYLLQQNKSDGPTRITRAELIRCAEEILGKKSAVLHAALNAQ